MTSNDTIQDSEPASSSDAAEPEHAPTITVRLKSVTWEAEGVVSLRLVTLDGLDLPPFEPGAHVDLHLPDGTIRQYSLCGDIKDRTSYVVAVRHIEGGRATSVIHASLRAGMVLTIGWPRNNFPFAAARNYIFAAGGIGVTPLLPMIRAAKEAGASWVTLLCARRAEDVPFLNEVLALGGEVSLHVSEEGTRLDAAARFAHAPPDTMLYCCGPESLMLAVEDASRGWPDGSVRFEWFAARTRPEDEVSDTFKIVCARSGLTLIVPPDNSVLGVLLGAGFEVARSCEQGVCGTCEVRVLEGEIDHRDSILSAEERATNETMMTCVSRARGPRLVLDV